MKIVEFENRVDPDEATPNQMPDIRCLIWTHHVGTLGPAVQS